MNCPACHTSIDSNAKFCFKCGILMPSSKNIVGSVDLYFKKKELSCQICGQMEPSAQAEFHENIGMFFQRHEKHITGRFCRDCAKKYFKKYTITTLILGWWGVISLFLSPIYIIGNIYNYARLVRALKHIGK